jgi:hypothetical protein
VSSEDVCVEPAGTFAVCILVSCCFSCAEGWGTVLNRKLMGLFVLPFGLCTLVHFGLFSSLNLKMCSSPARSRKMRRLSTSIGPRTSEANSVAALSKYLDIRDLLQEVELHWHHSSPGEFLVFYNGFEPAKRLQKSWVLVCYKIVMWGHG